MPKKKELNVANVSHQVYMHSAMVILQGEGILRIAGLGHAMVTAAKLATTLLDMGYVISELNLEIVNKPGRMVDRTATGNTTVVYVKTGRMVRVPRLLITMRK